MSTLANELVFAQRYSLVRAPHVMLLNAVAESLAKAHGCFPYFDPSDGGNNARVLIVLETPGPSKALVRFVSRDNPSPTQQNLKRLLVAAGLERNDTIIWNIVPWVQVKVGSHAGSPRRSEIEAGINVLLTIIPLLPRLQWIILAGKSAQQATSTLHQFKDRIRVASIPHPSLRNLCTNPSLRIRIQQTLSAVAFI